MIRDALEAHLPDEPFALRFTGFDNRLPHNRECSPIRVFDLSYSPANWRDASWILDVFGALRIDSELIRVAMAETGFSEMIEYLKAPRCELWKDLAFGRSILWDTKQKEIHKKDRNQLETSRA